MFKKRNNSTNNLQLKILRASKQRRKSQNIKIKFDNQI